MREGQGTETWPGGTKYEGEFKADKFHGKGIITKGRSKYAGDFVHGRKEGYGFMVFEGASTYEGEWRGGRMEGFGEYILSDGSRYEGSWENGLKSDLGMHTKANGERFDGNWKGGKKNGDGVYRWNNGKTRKGIWHDDKLMKWTSNESFGSIINFTKGRPQHLNKKGNIKIIKEVKEFANHRVAAAQKGA